MKNHWAWADIGNFHNVRRALQRNDRPLNDAPVVKYRAKVKLHGTNAGIVISSDGSVTALSRSRELTTASDNAGFAKWVEERSAQWASLAVHNMTVIVNGEWCGPGIQRGVAVCSIPSRTFAVFAVRLVTDDGTFAAFVTDPFYLNMMCCGIPNARVIPWFGDGEPFTIVVDWLAPSYALQPAIDTINERVAVVERCDPFIKDDFGIEGPGEGLVFYPDRGTYAEFCELAFKAKGEKHQVVGRTKPVQADPTIVTRMTAFVDMAVTEARFEQGVTSVADGELVYDVQRVGKFLEWIARDIEKEMVAELEASGLDRKAAIKACVRQARELYLHNARGNA